MSDQDLDPENRPPLNASEAPAGLKIPDWAFWVVPIVIALLMRYAALELNSLSHDELSTWARTEYNKVRGVIEYGVKPDYHPPGHFLLIWLVKQLGWESAFALRLPSVVASLLSVGLMYRIGRMLYDRWTGSMAAMIMSVNWACVYYAQDARAYAFVILFALMGVDASIRVVRSLRRSERVSGWDWAQLVLSGAAGAYTHYYGLFFAGLLGLGCLAVLIRQPKALVKAAVGFASILVLYAPWVPILIDDLGHSKTWVARHGIEFFPRWWSWVFGGADTVAVMAAVVLVLGGWSMVVRKDMQGKKASWFVTGAVLAWLLVPGLVAFTKSLLSTPALTNRNILSSAPAAFLLIAVAIRHFPGRALVQGIIFSALIGTSVWDLVVEKDYYRQPTKEEYRDVVKAVVDSAPDAVFGRCGIKAHFAYYLKQYGSTVEIDKNLCRPEQLPEFVERNAQRELSFVRVHYKPEKPVLEHLDDAYLTTQLFKARDAIGMVLSPRSVTVDEPVALAQPIPGEEGGQESAAEQVESPSVEEGCASDFPALNRIGAWSVWPYRPGVLMDTMDVGVRLRRNTEDADRLLMCMRSRFPVQGSVRFTGAWSAAFGEAGGTAQLSARYYGPDNKWVVGEEGQRPVWMVKTTKEAIPLTEFDKTLIAPSAAKTVQLCMVVTGEKSTIELHDTCVQSSP